MGDLYLALAVLLLLSAGLFRLGMGVGRCGSRWAAAGVGLAATALLVLFALTIHGKLLVAKWLPLSSAIVLGNWIPLLAAVLCGVLAGRQGVARWRRAVFVVGLLGLAWFSVLLNFVPTSLPVDNRWTPDGVCLQSSDASCSACAAATLLKHYAIDASEEEMIGLSLTRQGGTPSLGLYRGLKLKTRGTPWDVEVVRGRFEDLLDEPGGPVVLRMRLPNDPHAYPEWLERLNLAPDAGHAMVLYGPGGDGRVLMGDPSEGLRRWPVEDIKARWRGEGLRLVRREGGATPENR